MNQAKGEVSPGYQAWYKGEPSSGRLTKRPHLQEFARSSQEQWGWLAKEREYLAETGKLKQQVRDMKFEYQLQSAAHKGEKNRLTKECEVLKAQIRKMGKEADNQPRSRADKRLIAGLKDQVAECQEDLERSEARTARLRTKWAKGTMARRKRLQQVMRDCELSVKAVKETNSALRERIFKQTQDAQADRRRYYNAITRMERQMEMFQDQLATNTQTLGLKSRQIRQLFAERDDIRGRIDEIGHYIYMKCLACEQMPRKTLLASVMGGVHRIMNELKSLQKDLTPRAAKRPNDASWIPKLEI
ncbi:uncharacterized protein [Nicotiana sylvestris]|uniref:uncharacterized protein n=1 Tax=Nicotiana sylvestris TaxID=4096 RepID=UPI00388C80AE